jgi:hypothetical protein
MPRRLWTEQELAQLREMAGQGWTASRIGRALGRSAFEVQRKRSELRLPSAGNPWQESSALGSSPERSRRGACARWHEPGCQCWRESGVG